MRIFKSHFKSPANGQMVETRRWYVDFADHKRIRRRMPTERCRTRKDAVRFGEMVERLVVAAAHGEPPDAKLDTWLCSLSKATLTRFAKFGLVDTRYTAAAVPLVDHLHDFLEYLRTTKARHGFHRSETYIHNKIHQLETVIEACGFAFWSDVTREKVESYLGELERSAKTYNAYAQSVKLFGSWMVETGRASTSAVEKIKLVRVTRTERRRPLTEDEFRRLLATTASGPVRYGMGPLDRCLLYLSATELGLRSGELRALRVRSFDFDDASVRLGPEHTKNHEEAVQYLKRERAEQWRTYLAGRQPDEPVFNMPLGPSVVRMLRADLKASGVEPVDQSGAKVVFHCFRHRLAGDLDRTGASLRERMHVLRHSVKGSLTLDVYTVLRPFDLRRVVANLPDYGWPTAAQSKREVA